MNKSADLLKLYEDKLLTMSTEVEELNIASKHDAGDLAENSGQVAVRQKLFEAKDEVAQIYEYMKFIELAKPITDKCICLGSWFTCSYDGKQVDALLAYYTDIDFVDNGILVIDYQSKVGRLLCGKDNPKDIIFEDVKITNIKM